MTLSATLALAAEWALPRLRGVRANSLVECAANPLAEYLGKVPVVGKVLARLASPN